MRRKGRGTGQVPPGRLVAVGCAAMLAVLGGCRADSQERRSRAAPAVSSTAPNGGGATRTTATPGGWSDIPEIVRRLQPSVVTIFSGHGLGSGVVWSADGIVVTVNHVVADGSNVQVGFADGQRVAGTVQARDAVTDLAVIRVPRRGLPAADFATRLPEVGELAVAIGSPLGFEETVTAGIISGTQRAIPGSAASTQSLVDLLQTDAAISPGNSGGALVDAAGRVVGLNEAYIPPAAGAVSIGFAIPAPTVRHVVDQLLRNGHADHAYLGAQLGELTARIAAALEIDRRQGVVVLDVGADGPADQAGLQPGDVITAIGDQDVTTVEDVLGLIRGHRPGDIVGVAVDRHGEEKRFDVKLAERPARG